MFVMKFRVIRLEALLYSRKHEEPEVGMLRVKKKSVSNSKEGKRPGSSADWQLEPLPFPKPLVPNYMPDTTSDETPIRAPDIAAGAVWSSGGISQGTQRG